MTQKRLLILGAVLIATGIGTPVMAILADGPGAEQPRPPALEEFLESSPEPDLTKPPVVDMDKPVPADAGDRDGRVPPGSGTRKLEPVDASPPVTRGPLPESAATPGSAAPGSATPEPAGTTVLSTPPAELEPPPGAPVPLPEPEPVPLPGPEETTPTVIPPPPLPEDDER